MNKITKLLASVRLAFAERFPNTIGPIGSRAMRKLSKLHEVAPGVCRVGGPTGPMIELVRR